jgi:hypothetical protein
MAEEVRSIDVIPYEKKNDLSEIYQKTGIQFAFVSAPEEKASKQCHAWILCRDFLNDAAWLSLLKKSDQIYGFKYDAGSDPPIDHSKMRILVRASGGAAMSKETMFDFINRAVSVVRYFEQYAGVGKSLQTRAMEVGNIAGTYAFLGPKMWMSSPFMISLYTLLIRVCVRKFEFTNKEELLKAFEIIGRGSAEHGDNDVSYLRQTYHYLHAVIDIRKQIKFKKANKAILMSGASINTFHNRSGVVSLVNGNVPDADVKKAFQEAKK